LWTLADAAPLSLAVLDLQGRTLATRDLGPQSAEGQYTLPLGDFPAGIYLLRIASGGHTRTEKLVITR
jgi:hypothetical protein